MPLHKNTKKIKFLLVFFYGLLLTNCGKKEDITDFKIHYNKERATAISFDSSEDTNVYDIFVKGVSTTPMLGTFTQDQGKIVFEPVIPFSNGGFYELKKEAHTILEFEIEAKKTKAPALLSIYPSNDSVPENLLKIYFVFSQPMQAVGKMTDYITVYNKTDGKDATVFLELENELWNAKHTQLTLWLDPGRIKRDLIPNKEKGLPLQEGKEYEISISDELKGANGMTLSTIYTKTLSVISRDTQKPSSKNWEINPPKSATKDALTINFNEALDAILLKESFLIKGSNNEIVTGNYNIGSNENQLIFKPDTIWKIGNYKIKVDPILEDLAGNNLKHLFDQNISLKTTDKKTVNEQTMTFSIE
ncbi:Ig-like domain-containing protein [uncultured Maribacter sp.]|uniref:Ig-like domain-containing protein n=1 Tax=uncultured Maribacter sp. TaxID=431308 RepID=UPI0026285CB8|nr:Ig-like domain-containing protein [uncultured Maribacter sp.]